MLLQTLRLNFKVIVTFLSILITRVSSRCPNALSVEDNNEITENGKFHLKSQDSQYLTVDKCFKIILVSPSIDTTEQITWFTVCDSSNSDSPYTYEICVAGYPGLKLYYDKINEIFVATKDSWIDTDYYHSDQFHPMQMTYHPPGSPQSEHHGQIHDNERNHKVYIPNENEVRPGSIPTRRRLLRQSQNFRGNTYFRQISRR